MSPKDKRSIISLFCGAGGLDLGFEEAGFQPIVAYDILRPAVETYNHNRNTRIARTADLSRLEARDIISDIENSQSNSVPAGLVGGPPCQAFSLSNVYPRAGDIRRTLPGQFAYLLKELNARYRLKFFVFENVRGITSKRHQQEFARFRSLFEDAGFRLYEALLNARDYGVPQDRPRVFVVGINSALFKKEDTFGFPFPLMQRYKTVREAFAGAFDPPPWPEPAFFRRDLSPADIPFHPNHWTMVPRSPKFENGQLSEGQVRGRSFRVLAWDKPSWTVAYGHREIHVHPEGKRRLSIFEAMILQGFPRDYVLLGNLSKQVKLVSDAVPPPLAYHLAKAIDAFLARTSA